MVSIRIASSQCCLKVLGHAGAGPRGADIVCAAVSALVMTLGENVLALEKAGVVKLRALGAEPGAAIVWAEPAPGRERQAAEVFRVVERGLRRLARQYPGYVRVR